MRSFLLAATLLLVAGSASGEDRLLLRDGSHRSGRLEACVADRCMVDGLPVPRAQISWIVFDAPEAVPPTIKGRAADDAVGLRDGSVHHGELEGLSLGTVTLGELSFERKMVAWVRFAAPETAGDVLVLRDGSSRRGALDSCAGGICRVDSQSVARSAILLLGFAAEESDLPPAATQERDDEIHLRNGTVMSGQIGQIDAVRVATVRGSYPRAEVAWAYFALPSSEPGDLPGQLGAPPDLTQPGQPEPPGDLPSPSPPVAPPQPPPALPPSAALTGGGQGERSALWTGMITGRARGTDNGTVTDWRFDIEVRMREYLYPLRCPGTGRSLERVGSFSRLIPEGSVLTNRYTARGPDFTCSGQGSATVHDTIEGTGLLQPSASYLKTANRDLTSCIGFDIPRGNAMYYLSVPTRSEDRIFITCMPGDGSFDDQLISPSIGSSPILPRQPCGDLAMRTMDDGNGIMRGAYTGPCSGMQMDVAWSVCREGAGCPPPPVPEDAPAEDCAASNSQRALYDHELANRQRLIDALQQRYDRYRQILDQAQQYQSDFEQVALNCQLWQAARFLMSFLVSNYSPQVPGRMLPNAPGRMEPTMTDGYNPAKELSNFLSFLEKVLAGDGSWALPNTEVNGYFSGEDLWDAFKTGYQALGPSSPEALLAGIQSCGDPLTQDAIYQDAVRYLRLLQQIGPLMDGVNETLNDLRTQDLKLLDQWNKWYRSCLEEAECKGVPPDCGTPPPGAGAG